MTHRPGKRGWLRLRRSEPGERGADDGMFVEIQPGELASMFAAPSWLRDLGFMAWLLVGVTALLVAAVWLLSLLHTIVAPVLTATIVAAVLSPVVRLLAQRLPRAAAAATVFLTLIVLAIALVVLVLGGITSQAEKLEGSLQGAVRKIQGWIQDAGVSAGGAQSANEDASSTVSSAFHALIDGLGTGIRELASLAVFLSFTALSLFFLLKDGPVIRRWTERHMGVPAAVGHTIVGRTLQALRGYFTGVTAVAAFNAIVIGLGALVLGVSNAGSIAVVNFVAAYIPYLGAWSAGAFTVLIALGSEGPEIALVMAVIVLLANGALQQLIQPIAFGAALGIHPLAVLIVTIAGGALFGTIGLVLAAPLTSAALHVSSDLARARARENAEPPAGTSEQPEAPVDAPA
jgi:predicted PurR-regulated permease PerM